MKKITNLRLQNLLRNTGLLKLGLVILTGLMFNIGRTQNNFATAQVISGNWGAVTNDNSFATPDADYLATAGFVKNAPLWYRWTAPQDGEVELDTVNSLDNFFSEPLDTVVAVYSGTNLTSLNQVAANDDLFPISSSISQINESGSGDYAQFVGGPGGIPVISYAQPYYGPSHLRFNAKGGAAYYIAVDSKSLTGPIILNWAYKSSGVFRFATEDFDFSTGMPLYQTAQTESALPAGTANDVSSAILTYYTYNVPGALVTVTRAAGSSGRVTVDYSTIDGTGLPTLPIGDAPAYAFYTNITYYTNSDGSPGTNFLGAPLGPVTNIVSGDYTSVSNTLVFDDFEMSKTILIPINPNGGFLNNPNTMTNLVINGFPQPSQQPINNLNNTVFGIALSNPQYDLLESGDVSQPRLDDAFSTAIVKILNTRADPYGPDIVPVVVTNIVPNVSTNVVTNTIIAAFPTNLIFNFEKANYRVPADVNRTAPPGSPWTVVTLYVERFGTNGGAATLNYRINNFLGNDQNANEEQNILFPLQPGSDYAVPTPAPQSPIRGVNSDFNMVQGAITFPATGVGSTLQKITFTVTNSSLTKFNKDFKIQLYRNITVNSQTRPALVGMNNEATVTILFNDQNPPAGSVDELYNADFNSDLALDPSQVPSTTPPNNSNPGVSGEVFSMAVLTNDETIIAGDFPSYNGITRTRIALVNTDGSLDEAFDPGDGANAAINSVVISSNQFYIGGSFTSFDGSPAGRVARLNSDGSIDGSFNSNPGADGTVRAVAVQADGKVLIGGDFNHIGANVRHFLARLNANGSLDTSFDSGSILSGPVYSLALPPNAVLNLDVTANGGPDEFDQPVTLGGANSGTLTVNFDMQGVPDDMRVFYGNTNVTAGTGVLIYDTGSIPGTGSFVLPFGPTNGLSTNMITIVMDQGGGGVGTLWSYTASVNIGQAGQGLLVGGQFNVAGQTYANIARLGTNGLLDTSFNPGTGTDNKVLTLGWQPNNQIVAGGIFTHVNGSSLNHIARFNSNGSIDTTNFFVGTGADDVVHNITLQADGTMYVGGAFSLFNGTHRRGFTRLYSNGTVDTTFLDTAYNQFAGLKRIYSYDTPAVFASAVQSDGNVLIGGAFDQVGGGQADPNVCNVLDDELGYFESFDDANLWVEPKTRDGVRNRSSFARLIGGATPGPGNIILKQNSYSANRSQSALSVSLVRTNGMLGPVSANFAVMPNLAQSGTDYVYNHTPPLFWIAWDYLTHPSRVRNDGLFGQNGFLVDPYGLSLSSADALINNQSAVTVSITPANPTNLISGNLNAQFQLANPSCADTFYLGGENIPLGGALGASIAPFTLIDDAQKPGQFSFASSTFIATNLSPSISVLRSNGVFGVVSMKYSTTNDGTAVVGTDYTGITNQNLVFNQNVISNGFNVTIKNNGLIYTNIQEKTVDLVLSDLGNTPPGATFGISNAVLRLINPNYQGYVTLSATNYVGTESSGFVSFIVSRVSGNLGTLTVQYTTTNGTAVTPTDYLGSTNTLQWNSGDASPRTVNIPLNNTGTVGANKEFGVWLFNPKLNNVVTPALMGTISNATLTISNDNSYGTLQFSLTNYVVNENGGYATITVIRTGGAVGTVSVDYTTSNGANTVGGVNYGPTNGTLVFAPGQTSSSFLVPVIDDLVADPTPFNFVVSLTNPTNAALGSLANANVNILDVESFNQPPGSPDTGFDSTTGMNGDVFTLALQSGGQILAGGNFTTVGTTGEGRLARLNTDGSLDTAFLGGLSGANGAVLSVVSQTDDRVLIGGAFTFVDDVHRSFIARLMTDGSLDTSFNPGPGADNTVNALAETFIGGVRKIYVGGAFNSISSVSSPGVVRLNNDGTADGLFAVGLGADGQVYALAAYPTNSLYAGKVLIGGTFTHFNGHALNHFARLNVDGSVDTNFNANLGVGPNDAVRAIVMQPDGRLLVGGSFTNFNGTNLNHIARLNGDGTLDAAFTTNVGVGANSAVKGIALQADNRIILVGQFTQANGVTRNHITRLMPTGVVDPSINFGDGANGDVNAVVVQPVDAMLVIGGGFSLFDGEPHASIARIYGGSETGSGKFEFTSGDYQVTETGIVAPITIRRTGGTSGTNVDGSGDIFVNFSTSDGTAKAGTNYVAVNVNVDFPPGEVLKTVAIPILDDFTITPNLTVNLALTNPTAPAGIGNQPTAVLTILNSDNAVSFSSGFYTQVKNTPTGVATIDVIRLGGTNDTATVDFYTTTNGTAVIGMDYIPTNTTLTFNPGQSDVQVQVQIVNNALPEGNLTVGLLLTNVVNTLLVAPSNATLTIIDTVSSAGRLSFAATNFIASEGDATASLTVVRTNGSSGSVSVSYTTVPGTAQPAINYTTTSGTVSFDDGETIKTITVPLAENTLVQGTVNFSVNLFNATGGAILIPPTNATVSISDNDIGFIFLNVTNYVRETNGYVPIFVERVGSTNGGVSVDYATTDGTALDGVNYNAVSGTLTFAVNETLKAISLPLIYVPQVTGDLTLTMGLSNPSIGTSIGSPSNAVIVVQDADAGLSFTNSAMSILKNVGNAVITVVCSNPSVEPVLVNTNIVPLSVNYSTSDGTAVAGQDYTGVSGTLVFTNGIGTNTFNVPIMNNSLIQGDHYFNVSLSNPTPPGQLVFPSNQVVTIIDNNSGLSFSSPVYTVLKTGVAGMITVLRTDNTNTTSSVNYATADGTASAGTDYIATNGILVFTNGETSKTFFVGVIDNTTVQPDKTVLLQLSNPTNGFLTAPYAATLTIHDTTGSLVVPAGSMLLHESLITNGIIDPGENVTMLFAFRASGGLDIPSVFATLLVTNGITSPSPASAVACGSLTVGGAPVSRQFSFTANGTNSQQIIATFLINNGSSNIGTAGFTYTLGMRTNSFYNTNGIIINDFSPALPPYLATPYPSGISVSNVGGLIVKTVVTLTNIYHTSPEDVDILLVSPAQQDTLLMGHAGAQNVIKKVTLTFDDASTNSLSQDGVIVSGTNKPTAYLPVPNFP